LRPDAAALCGPPSGGARRDWSPTHSKAEADHYSAFATHEADGERADDGETMQGFPINRIINDSGFERVDLMKVDIEGAEVELFTGDTDWLKKVGAVAIEFHHDSRAVSRFDEITGAYGFRIYDQDAHTVLAVREGEEAD
jgi:hypothetical protein